MINMVQMVYKGRGGGVGSEFFLPMSFIFTPISFYLLIDNYHLFLLSQIADLNTDVLKAKRANADRIKDFSKQLNEFNKVSLGDQRRLPYSSEASGVQISKKKLESNRERAIQFAKNIPRPAIKGKEMKSFDVDDEDDMADRLMSGSEYGVGDQKAFKLEELQAKHLESKRSIDAMRKQMGM